MTHTDTEHLQRLLSVCDEERLIRFIYLLRKKGYTDTALILALELGLREAACEHAVWPGCAVIAPGCLRIDFLPRQSHD